jgi:hypothetical protein
MHMTTFKNQQTFCKCQKKRLVTSHTFRGVSESPRPNRGSTEKPEITHDVIVSGTCLRIVVFPSNLKHKKKIHFLSCLHEVFTDDVNN